MSRALLLVAHGSPDPDWRRPREQLRERLVDQLGEGQVGLAYLAHPPHIEDVAAELAAAGFERALVVAALLSPGGRHVKRDIPAAVDAARERLDAIELELAPGALGEDEAVVAALADAALTRLGACE